MGVKDSAHISKGRIELFRLNLLKWFNLNRRDFYWRSKNISDYQFLICEILLQRTKAETVNNFLPSFFKKYPSWSSIKRSDIQNLSRDLKPLGLFNQRAKRVHALSKLISPKKKYSEEEIRELPNIGQYICNSYKLVILGKPAPLLDVNMARVLERYFGPRTLKDIRYDHYLQDLAKTVVLTPESKEINWAILDLGALVCKHKPKCATCPLYQECSYLQKE